MPRQKTKFTCGVCGVSGFGTTSVPCGWCAIKTGVKSAHSLCDRCFIKGCPVMNPPAKKTNGHEDNI